MAQVNVNNRNKGKKGKPQKLDLRVDFTPMVDMNMLLITFFMFCTTLSKPQVMDIVMPTRGEVSTPNLTADSHTTTLILGENDLIYYYLGIADNKDPGLLKVTDYSTSGLRSVLLSKNIDMVQKVQALNQKKNKKEISENEFKSRVAELKKTGNETVIIKPTDAASYMNLVYTLDEMQLCNIGKYAIVDVDDVDNKLIAQYKANKTKSE